MVRDMDKAIKFYEMLGLTLQQRWDNHYAMISAKDIVIGLHPSDGSVPASSQMSIGFMIDDINDAKKLLDDNKVAYTFDDGKSGAYVNFKDDDGTYLYYVQAKWLSWS
ncbi:MAG: Glyoxalase-like protein [Bacteroidetes bacterium]|nr:Glyoxalase-like protein [Bacteroidota bacterium]